MTVQQEIMSLYKEHNINPLNMGCLPALIQMPIIMGLYYAILYSAEIKTHSFLWFDLGSTDIWMTAIAGVVYFVQAKVSLQTRYRSSEESNETDDLRIADYDCHYFIVFDGCTPTVLGSRRVILNCPNLYWTQIFLKHP